MARRKHVQLTIDQARRPTGRGGWRPGAGRPRTRNGVPHERREACSRHIPQHVTLRVIDGVSLRRDFLMPMIRDAISRSHKAEFRIIEFNVLSNHVHLITEASSKEALANGIHGLEIRIARSVNKKLRRSGKLFEDRYHARALRTPAEVRNALRYVLNNARHHAAENGNKLAARWFDPYSSAAWFDGWASPLPDHADWQRELLRMPRPTARAQCWRLSVGWRTHGLIRLDDVPGGTRRRGRR